VKRGAEGKSLHYSNAMMNEFYERVLDTFCRSGN
jgi:hypothetical protein